MMKGTVEEFSQKLNNRFAQPDHRRWQLAQLSSIEYKGNAGAYIEEFEQILQQVSERLLDDSVVSFMKRLTFEIRQKYIGNQDNFQSIETMYASLMRYKAFNQNNKIATARKTIQEDKKDFDRKSKPYCVYGKKRGHVRESCWKLNNNKEDEIVLESENSAMMALEARREKTNGFLVD
jgi:hypothetical protein